MASKLTQKTLIFEYFAANANRNIQHAEVVDWATAEWEKRTGSKLRDPDRMIRTLYQEGHLEKIDTGVYRFDPARVLKVDPRDFTSADKNAIFSRDGHKCVMCGRGKRDGMKLHADHVIPRDKGGTNELSNGQTLCSECNMLKKNYGQLEFGRKFFEKNLAAARRDGDIEMQDFLTAILRLFDEYGY